MGSQVPLQLCQRGEIQTTLHTDVFLSFLVLQLMGAKLTGVSKTSAAHTAAGGADKVCERSGHTQVIHMIYYHHLSKYIVAS